MSSTRSSNPKHSTKEILNQFNRLMKGNQTGHFMNETEQTKVRDDIIYYTTLDKKFSFKKES